MKMKTMMTIQMMQIKVMQRRKRLMPSKFSRNNHTNKTNSLSAVKTIQISYKNNRKQARRLKVIKLMAMTTMMRKSTRRIKTRILFLTRQTLSNILRNSNKRMMKPRTKRRNMINKTNSSKSSHKSRLERSKCLI